MTTPCLHLTTRNLGAALGVEIPQTHKDQHRFPASTQVVIALESDPSTQIHTKVWGNLRRYATILRMSEHSDRFEVGTDVSLWLESNVPTFDTTRKETIDNCLILCAKLRRMGFDENSRTTSIIPEDALANAAWATQPTSPQALTQARYAGIYLVEYGFLKPLGGGEYKLTGKDQLPRDKSRGLQMAKRE